MQTVVTLYCLGNNKEKNVHKTQSAGDWSDGSVWRAPSALVENIELPAPTC